jgi:tRNA-specific 2-thiouridylase
MIDDHRGCESSRVVVGMSGGVDSSVVAALLKSEGYDVIGMTMQIWHKSSRDDQPQASAGCCTVDAVDDARRVARILGIPYYVPNFRAPFSAVVDDFVSEYEAGRTPNPCVRCNQHVRFEGLLQKADEVGAELIATGHYARVEYDHDRCEFVLKKGLGPKKDQSYVLHTLQQRHLARLKTPLGALEKSRVRELAEVFGLPVAQKPDSQEICFVANDDYRAFLRERGIDAAEGPVIDAQGKQLGVHNGLHNFTIGQRKGLGVQGSRPTYVIELRPRDNAVVVGSHDDATAEGVVCRDLHFTGAVHSDRFTAHVRVRAHAEEVESEVRLQRGEALIEFGRPVWGATPGQLAVMYDGDRVIGGGTICRLIRR